MTGPFPPMSGYPQLHVLHLENNSIHGVIPASIGGARKLTVFDAALNKYVDVTQGARKGAHVAGLMF